MAYERISIDPGRMGGLPCIRDMRVTVSAVLGQLAAGRSMAQLLEAIPTSSRRTSSLALAGLRGPSLLLMRSADHLTPDEQADLLLANLPPLAKELEASSVVSISMGHLRVRPLPMR